MERRTRQFLLYMHKAGALSLLYFESLLLQHARPFKNLWKDKIHQDLWQMAGLSNLHGTSNSHWCFSKIFTTRNQDSWRASGMSNCKVDQPLLVANQMQDPSMQGVMVGEALVVLVLVSVFSQSCLFESKTKVCKLVNMLVGKLCKLLRWWWWRRWQLLLLLLLIFIVLMTHGHGRGKRLGTCLVLKLSVLCVVSLQHVSMFDYAGGASAWTRQLPWYVPCGEAMCVVCR